MAGFRDWWLSWDAVPFQDVPDSGRRRVAAYLDGSSLRESAWGQDCASVSCRRPALIILKCFAWSMFGRLSIELFCMGHPWMHVN